MAYSVLIEKEDGIMCLGTEKSKEEAERKMINYIENTEVGFDYFDIWIEEEFEGD